MITTHYTCNVFMSLLISLELKIKCIKMFIVSSVIGSHLHGLSWFPVCYKNKLNEIWDLINLTIIFDNDINNTKDKNISYDIVLGSMPIFPDITIFVEFMPVPAAVNNTCPEGYICDIYRDTCIKDLCQMDHKYDKEWKANCTPLALPETEYRNVSNNVIYWIAAGRHTTVTSFQKDGLPVICTNFTRHCSSMGLGARNQYSPY